MNTPSYTFTIDKENNIITIKRAFAADRELIWEAFTTREILDQWWAPVPWHAKTKSMDLKSGGHWLYAMVGPNGEEHWSKITYTKVHAPEIFTGDDAFTDSEGNIHADMPQSKWEVIFKELDTNTVVEFHISYPDLKQLEDTIEMGFKEGITMTMDALESLLISLQNEKLPSY